MLSLADDSVGLPFITNDGYEFSLLCGFTKDGDPITDSLMPDDTKLAHIIKTYKDALEKSSLDTNMSKVTTYDKNSLLELRRTISEGPKYDLGKFDRAFSDIDKFNYAMSAITKSIPTKLNDLSISLTDLIAITKHPRNNRSNLTISRPMVLRQLDSDKKGLSAGRIFVLYSSNQKYDLTDPAVIKRLETELKAHMKNKDRNDIEGALGYLRGGVGIITLDYPHSSMQELAAIRRKSKSSKLNRYATPAESVVSKRFITMLAEIGDIDVIKQTEENHTRLAELKKVTGISVIKKDTIVPFLEALAKKAKDNDPAAMHFLSIIRSITSDSNMGNYVTTREMGSLADMRKHKYPGEKVNGVNYTFVPGTSGKPKIFEINQAPLVFIPQAVASEIGYEGTSQPMRFNLEALLDLIENGDNKSINKPSVDVVNDTLAIFDSLMQNHTNGLNRGIKIPPAMMKSGKSLWGPLSETEDNSLYDKLTTPVKDIRSAALVYNLDNLITSVEATKTSKINRAGDVLSVSDIKEKLNTELNSTIDAALDELASSIKVTETVAEEIRTEAEANLNAIRDNWLSTVSKNSNKSTIINASFLTATTKLRNAITSKVVKTEYSLSEVRSNKFDRPSSEKLAELALKHGFSSDDVTRIFNTLTYVSDADTLRELENEVKSILSKIPDKKFLQNYFDPVFGALNNPKAKFDTKTATDELVSLFDQKEANIPRLDTATHEVISNLENFVDVENFNPYKKTMLLQAYVYGSAEERVKLQPYLDSSITNMNDPLIIAQAIYDSILGGYPINEQSKLLVELSKKNPQLLSAVMSNEEVVNALANTTEQDWASEFATDVSLVSQLDNINMKTQYLNALSAVLKNLRPILSSNVIQQMDEILTEARNGLDLARSGGNGPDLRNVDEESLFYSKLDDNDKERFSAALMLAQKEVGNKLAVMVDVLSNQKSIQDPEVFKAFSEAKALLMESLSDNLSKNDFKTVSTMLAKLFNSVC